MDLFWENNDGTTASICFSEQKQLPSSLLRYLYDRQVKEPSFFFHFDWFQRGGGGGDDRNHLFSDFQIVPRSHFPDWDDLLRYLVNTRFTHDHVVISHVAESIISAANSIAGGRDQEPLITVALSVFTTTQSEQEGEEHDQVVDESDPEEDMDDVEGNRTVVQESVLVEAMEGWKNEALGEEESKDSCAICFQKLGRVVKVTPCGHYYHQSCIFQWLNTSIACPLCRFQLITT